ncbi:MAG TPA: asparagine synthase-related protein [Thermoleophilaceae bacterium]|nr:asparagine synthase-related protein [Thermoleophilaceae bacterium]
MPSTPGRGRPTRTVPAGYQLTALETVAGSPYGTDPVAPPLPAPSGATPRQALERSLLDALQRSPCLVTFSGGRDSSTLLALTARLARDHGLPAPVPVTHRFPRVPESDEGEWQELVIGRLGLDDWELLEWDDEMDIIGPLAAAVLGRHGQVMPFNAHFMAPMLERARGGSLVTGVGGDELFGPVDRPVLAGLRYARRRPGRSDLRPLARELAPRSRRIARVVSTHPFREFGWIRPEVRRLLAEDFARAYAMPLRWDGSIDQMWRSRYVQCSRATLAAIAADHDADLRVPFMDPVVLADIAGHAGAAGLGKRESSLPALAGELLPPELFERRTKASFDAAFFHRHARAFAASWDGTGVDPSLVDPELLHAEWLAPRPSANTFSLMQQAWRETRRLAANPAPGSAA